MSQPFLFCTFLAQKINNNAIIVFFFFLTNLFFFFHLIEETFPLACH